METIDSKVLALLAHDGRMSWADLGAAVGLSPPAAAERVRRLEQRGLIRGYAADLDARALGDALTAFISVSVADPRHRSAFVAAVKRTPEILECHHITGEDDYLLKVRCRDTDDLERLLTGTLKAHGWSIRTRTTIALSPLKETHLPPSLARRRR
jgi:Lrp/AsnC family leucine-responsive transcriptional regulator